MSQDDKRKLEIALAKLLSLDLEDCEEILGHVMSFDSEGDLLEHLFSLLGQSNKKEIEIFAQNVMKYANGEHISFPSEIAVDDNGLEDRKLPAQPCQISENAQISKKKQENQNRERKKKEKQKSIEEEKRIALEEEEAIRVTMEQIRIEQEEALLALKKRTDQMNTDVKIDIPKIDEPNLSGNNTALGDETILPEINTTKTMTVAKTEKVTEIPKQGKAKIVCGCFGTVHKPLTNCLNCGRISCSKEGYGYCPFCTNLIDAPSMTNESDKATLHKERLLKFDKEAARRTVIYDDQADYYSNSSSMWLSEDQHLYAKSKEDARQKDMHTVKKHVLNLQF